jgi:small-conductance mechanosensitive channel/CRP-like cAMP-binding protein
MKSRFVGQVLAPFTLFVVFFGAYFFRVGVLLDPKTRLGDYLLLPLIIEIGCWLSAAGLANRLTRVFLWEGLVARAIGGSVPRLLSDIVSVLIYLLAITGIIGSVLGLPLTGFWTTSGVFGLVLGFALRNMILDLFTGLAVNIDRTFKIGDWLELHRRDENVLGQVEELKWRTTRIRTEANTTVMIPNSQLGTMLLSNYLDGSRPVRFETEFIVDYSVTTERVLRILEAAASSAADREGFAKDRPPVVLLDSQTEMGWKYVVRFWLLPWSPYSPTTGQDLINRTVARHLSLAGVRLAYPREDVHLTRLREAHVESDSVDGLRQLLARIPLFDILDPKELDWISTQLDYRVVSPGSEVIRRGETGGSMFIVVEGFFDVFGVLETTQEETHIGTLEPGEFFGELSFLTGEVRSATVRARSSAVVYEIESRVMNQLIERRPQIADQLSRVLATRQLENERTFIALSAQEQQKKIENFAQKLFERMRSFLSGLKSN